MLLVSPADETPVAPCDVQPEEIDVALAVGRYEEVTGRAVRRISHRWAGLRSFVADHLPVVGPDPDVPDFVWLAGQGGVGIMTAPALARIAAAQITAGAPPPDLDLDPAIAGRGAAAALISSRRRRPARPLDRGARLRRARADHRGIEVDLAAQAEQDRVARPDLGALPMGPVAHRVDRRLGRARAACRSAGPTAREDCAAARRSRPAGPAAWTAACSAGPRRLAGLTPVAIGRASLSRAFGSFCARSISLRSSWPLATGSRPRMPAPTSPSAMPLTSSGCRPQNSAICSKVRLVFSTSHTAVALGINGRSISCSRRCDCACAPGMRARGCAAAVMGAQARRGSKL